MSDSTMTAAKTDAKTDVPGTDAQVPVLTFGAPLPGLDGITRYALVGLDDNGALFSLRSVDNPDVRLLLAPTWVCAPQDYQVELDDDIVTELSLGTGADAAVFLVVTPGESLAASTVNMLAPVIVNSDNGRAAQVVLNGTDYPLRAPITQVAA